MKQTTKNRNLFKIGAVLLLTVMWVITPFILNGEAVQADELSDTRIQASLAGSPINGTTPAGFSEYRIDDSNRRRLSVQANSVNLAAGTALGIYINNALVGQMGVDGFGNAFFSIDTGNGQNVPVINTGNPIQVRQDTTVILSGTFGTVNPTPSPSGSPSGSPTASPSVSPSGSPNPSPSVSPSGSPNPSPSVSPSGSPTASPSPSVSPNPSPSVSPNPSPNAGDLFAGLTGATINGVLPQGFAQYELHSSRRELEIRVYQVNLSSGTALNVIVNGASVGNLILESGGEGRLRLRSDDGQNVPNVVVGSTISINNSGSTILAGVFGGASPSPSPSPSVSPSPSGSPNPSPSPSPSASPSLGRYFETHPTGNQLNPPVTTNANAEFKVFLNAGETQATLTGEFHNLSSGQTGARIETTVGTTAVIHNFGAIGGTNGNLVSATINVTPVQVQQLRAGLWFAIITSVNNPNGEVGGRFTQHSNGGDFDGDGSNDFAVFRPSTGTWYSQNSEGFSAQTFGEASDVPVSADYDGDGRTDSAVFRNVNGSGVWEIKRSNDGGTTSTQFGFATDTPVRGDFDGDGLNDLAVFRASTGTWYVKKSTNTGFIIVQFGSNGDKPIVADFDGDGRDDVAVFRPSTGVWYWIRSSNGSVGIVKFGAEGDIPVSGDFDGDGRSDLSVFRPSTGVWYIFRSSDSAYDIRQFGTSGDIPVAGNYDGDNKTDIAVFRPSTGIWYIARSSDQTYDYRQFGLTGDIPTVVQ